MSQGNPMSEFSSDDEPASTRVAKSQLEFEIEFYESLLNRDPKRVEVLNALSQNLLAKGDRHGALQIDSRLSDLCPDDPSVFYRLACGYSVLGLIDSSLDSLKRALVLGFHESAYLNQDLDLEQVRKDPRFQDLLGEFLPA